jgi:hypothetical protein
VGAHWLDATTPSIEARLADLVDAFDAVAARLDASEAARDGAAKPLPRFLAEHPD